METEIYAQFFAAAELYAISKGQLCKSALAVGPSQIQQKFIIVSLRRPGIFADLGGVHETGGALHRPYHPNHCDTVINAESYTSKTEPDERKPYEREQIR